MSRKTHAARNNQKITAMTGAGQTAEQISLALGISIRTVRRRRADLGLKWTWRAAAVPKRKLCPRAITAKLNTPAWWRQNDLSFRQGLAALSAAP